MGRRSRKRRDGATSSAAARGSGTAGTSDRAGGSGAARTSDQAGGSGAAGTSGPARGDGSSPSTRASRTEARNEAARAALRPLAPGERPAAVTAGAIVASLLAIGNLVAYLAGLEVNGEKPELSALLLSEAVLIMCAVGMWLAKYWAVLGFQFLLGLALVFLALFAVRASSVLGIAVVLAIGIPGGILFWTLVKAMARIQMPERPPPRV